MLRWQADAELAELIRRYYRGQAGLWPAIRDRIDAQLRERGVTEGAYHIRLRPAGDGYEVRIDAAGDYANQP